MKNLDYQEIKRIEMELTRKLVEYINRYINIEEILEEIDFISPYLHDESSRLAFNIWLATDYIGNDNKTFIERFLKENFPSLTTIERQILEEKSYSYISIFQVLKYEDDYIYVVDILNNQEYKLWEPNLSNTIYEEEFIFSRVGKVLDVYGFVGDINYIPSSEKTRFLDEILKKFNNIRKGNPSLTMKEFLKEYALNIYKIYNELILDVVEIEEDVHSILFDELEEFESYLMNRDKGSSIQKHLSNLVNIFEYYLSDKEQTLSDLKDININNLFTKSMEDKFINSQDELNSYIRTLKLYLFFTSNKNPKFKNSYKEILNISKNRFYYMSKLNSNNVFDIDISLVNRIDSHLNNGALDMIMDFENFILFIGEEPLELTSKNKYIKRKYLTGINELLMYKTDIENRAPNQDSFPLIHLFYHISINLGISEIDKDFLVLNDNSIDFLKLSDEEKYYLIIRYLLNDEFLKEILLVDNINNWREKQMMIIKLLSNFNPNKIYKIDSDLSKYKDLLYSYYPYINAIGLIQYDLEKNNTISISNLGKKIFKYLNIEKDDEKSVVIHLDNYRNIF